MTDLEKQIEIVAERERLLKETKGRMVELECELSALRTGIVLQETLLQAARNDLARIRAGQKS